MRTDALSISTSSANSICPPELASTLALVTSMGALMSIFAPEETSTSRKVIWLLSPLMRSEDPELAVSSTRALSEKHSLTRPSAADLTSMASGE